MNYYNYDDELYHWGIKGMKWGVRRFRNRDDSLTPAGKERYDYYDEKGRSGSKSSSVKSSSTKNVSNTKSTSSTKPKTNKPNDSNMTDDEAAAARKAKIKKYVKVGAAVAGTALAAYGAYKAYELYTGRKQKLDPTTGFRLINKNMTTQQHLDSINPGRVRLFSTNVKNKEIIRGSSQNCMLCTTTYELRKRGFDVHAGYSTTGFTSKELFSKIYKNYTDTVKVPVSKSLTRDTSGDLLNSITDSILKQGGSGSRGNIMVYWKNGMGGHSMIWENVGGTIKFMDGQTGQEYKNFRNDILKNVGHELPVEILRTDNLEFNVPELKKFINSDTVFKTYVDHGAEITAKMATDARVQLAAAGAVTGATYAYDQYTHSSAYAKNKARKNRGGA